MIQPTSDEPRFFEAPQNQPRATSPSLFAFPTREEVTTPAQLSALAVRLQGQLRVQVQYGLPPEGVVGSPHCFTFTFRENTPIENGALISSPFTSVVFDLERFEKFGGRGYLTRVNALLEPLREVLTSDSPLKLVYGKEQQQAINAITKKTLGLNLPLVNVLEVVKQVRPDLRAFSLPAVLAEVLPEHLSHLRAAPQPVMIDALVHALDRLLVVSKLPDLQPQGLLKFMGECAVKQTALMRRMEDPNHYWMLRLRVEKIRDALRTELMKSRVLDDDKVQTEGEAGSATLRFSEHRHFDLHRVRERFPGLASAVERKYTKERIVESFIEVGMDRSQAVAVTESLYDDVGHTEPQARVFPRYSELIYKNLPGKPVSPKWRVHPEVTTALQLSKLISSLKKSDVISIDTETWGPEGERLDRDLCLIQIGVRPAGKRSGQVYLVNVKKLEDEARKKHGVAGDGINVLMPLKELLESEEVKKVAHHAQFERAQFAKYGIALTHCADTKTLVKELRPDLYSYTLRACCFEVLSEVISKDEQRSDWSGTLTDEQISYAAVDAEFTFKLYDRVDELMREADSFPRGSAQDLLWQAVQTHGDALRFARLSGLPPEYHAYRVAHDHAESVIKEQITAEAVRTKAEVLYRDESGSFSCKPHRVVSLNESRFQTDHPTVAARAVEESISEEALRCALFEEGISEGEMDAVIEELTHSTEERTRLDWKPAYDRYYAVSA